MKFMVSVAVLFLGAVSAQAQTSTGWRVTQPAWLDKHEALFGEFVARMGAAVEARKCGSVSSCMKSAANPYYASDPKGLRYYSDCADLPYYLRGYFAWKNGLPFSIASGVAANKVEGVDSSKYKDLRYTPHGNIPINRFSVRNTVSDGKVQYPNALTILNSTITDMTSSATLRMEGDSDEVQGRTFTDFYPVKINAEGIRPGTVIYDPNGHVAVVYKVTEDGRVFYIDAHPDNSLTMGMYTPKFARSKPGQGAGFKNFRPYALVDATQDSNGTYIGGRIQATRNINLPLFSLEQFYGNQPDPKGSWTKGKFVVAGNTYDYYDFVRLRLMKGELHFDPLKDMEQLTDDICSALKDRVAAVESARSKGISSKPHPERLPMNIYGTSGEWEDYSTPSRDARLKVSFMDLLNQAKANMTRYKNRDKALKYNGGNLAKDLLQVYSGKAQECVLEYKTTNGTLVRMNLEAARQRLFNMSFDPYHCIELRWGARSEQEMASCPDNQNKRAWYAAQKWLRYQSERTYDSRMDYSLSELTGPKPGAGVENPPDVDIVTYLSGLM